MHRPIITIAALILALGAVEGFAYWWMHPTPTGLGQPVLAYRPSRSAGVSPAARKPGVSDQRPEIVDRGSKIVDEKALPVSSSSTIQNSTSKIHNPKSSIPSPPPIPNLQSRISTIPSLTPLPELVSRSIPALRCTTGSAARIDREDGITVHIAFFEWDLESSNNVLEAFKHLPEECMGSIGMTLVKMHPPRAYLVAGQGTEVGSREEAATAQNPSSTFDLGNAKFEGPSSSSIQKSKIQNHQSSISSSSHLRPSTSDSPSSPTDHSLSFDHTEFRDSTGKPIHAFKGVWVSGASTLLGDGLRGGGEQSRQIRWNAARKRFQPAHARVIQAAVHGAANGDAAWQAFQETMLKDLTFER